MWNIFGGGRPLPPNIPSKWIRGDPQSPQHFKPHIFEDLGSKIKHFPEKNSRFAPLYYYKTLHIELHGY